MDRGKNDSGAQRVFLARETKTHAEIQRGDDLAARKHHAVNRGVRIRNQRHVLEHLDMLHALARYPVDAARPVQKARRIQFWRSYHL